MTLKHFAIGIFTIALFAIAFYFNWIPQDEELPRAVMGTHHGAPDLPLQSLGENSGRQAIDAQEPETLSGDVAAALERFKGADTLIGRVVDPSGEPIVGARIDAYPRGKDVISPPLYSALSQGDGAFVFKEIGAWFRIIISAAGFGYFDVQLGPSDVDPAFQPREFTLTPLSFASLVVTVKSDDGLPISEGTIKVSAASHKAMTHYQESLVRESTAGETAEFRLTDVPVDTDLELAYFIHGNVVCQKRLPPLTSGEVRRVSIVRPAFLRVALHFVDSETLEPVQLPSGTGATFVDLAFAPDSSEAVTTVWRPNEKIRFLLRDLLPSNEIAVPGPGLLRLSLGGRFFQPISEREFEVIDETPLVVELEKSGVTTVYLVDENGGPLRFNAQDYAPESSGLRFMVGSSRFLYPQVTVISGIDLPDTLGTLSPGNMASMGTATMVRNATFHEFTSFDIDVVALNTEVGLYIGEALITKRSISTGDEETTLLVPHIPRSTGKVRFRVIDWATKAPVTSFTVSLAYWATHIHFDAPLPQSGDWVMQQSDDGCVSLPNLGYGDYVVSITQDNVTLWSMPATLNAQIPLLDLGTAEIGGAALLEVLCVDSRRRPIVGAEVTVWSKDSMSYRGDSQSTTSIDGVARLRVGSGDLRIEARKDGYLPTFSDTFLVPELHIVPIEMTLGTGKPYVLSKGVSNKLGNNMIDILHPDEEFSYGSIEPGQSIELPNLGRFRGRNPHGVIHLTVSPENSELVSVDE